MGFFKKAFMFLKKRRVFRLINGPLTGTHFFERKNRLLRSIGIKIGKGTKIVGPIYVSANLEIGDNVWIDQNFEAQGNGTIIIEDNCDIAPGVNINTGGHLIGDENRRAGKGLFCTVRIGRGTWICMNSTVAKNTVIGKGNVIAAGAVVIKDTPDNVLVGGVPAHVIKSLSSDSRQTAERDLLFAEGDHSSESFSE